MKGAGKVIRPTLNFYITVFLKKPAIKGPRALIALVAIIYGLVLGWFLVPHLGDMRVPVMVYLCIILGMGVAVAVGTANHFVVIIGACFFILSDSLIAVNRFLVPISASSLLIMTTYYTGQFQLAFGAAKNA